MGDQAGLRGSRAIHHYNQGEKAFKERKFLDAAGHYIASQKSMESMCAVSAHAAALMMVSDLREAANGFETARALSQEQKEIPFEIASGINLGQVYSDLGETDNSEEVFDRAIKTAKENGVGSLLAMAIHQKGLLQLRIGEYEKAMSCCEMALTVFETIQAGRGLVAVRCTMGIVYLSRGQIREAEKIFRENMGLVANRQMSQDHVRILTNYAILHLMNNRLNEAAELLAKVLETDTRLGDDHHKAKIFVLSGEISGRDEPTSGLLWIQKGLALIRELKYKKGEVDILVRLSMQQVAMGDYKAGKISLEKARAVATAIGYANGKFRSGNSLAEVYSMEGHGERAMDITKNIVEAARKTRNIFEEIRAYERIGIILVGQNEVFQGLSYFERAVEMANNVGCHVLKSEMSTRIGMIFELKGLVELADEFKARRVVLMS